MSHLDRDFAYMNVQDNDIRSGHKGAAPKQIKQYVSVGEDYIPGGPVYRAMPYPPPPPPEDDFPPPPPPLSQDQYIHNDAGSFPPPPPDSGHGYHGGRYYEANDDYNAAPPLNVNVGISHSSRTHYSDYGPGGQPSAKSPYESRSDFTTSTTTYHGRQQSGGGGGGGGSVGYNAPHSPQHVSQPPSYNRAVPEVRNIPIQVRGQPPHPASSPTHVYSGSNVSSAYADVSSLPPNRGQISPQAMPSSAAYQKTTVPSNTYGSISPTSRPSRSMPLSTGAGKYASGPQQSLLAVAKPDKEAEVEVDVLTNLLLHNMENSSDPEFFGMCAKCNRKVMGESNGCTAMNLVYHITCFTCVSCNLMLQGKSFYSMENKPYCDECYFNTLEKCSVCSKPITDRLLRATGKPYHADCFVCVVCGKSLDGIPFTVDATSQIHCIEDFHKKFAPRCCVCHLPIMPESGQDETVRVVAMDRSFHVQCYRCEDCGSLLSSEAEGRGCYPLDDHILCKNCNAKRIQAMTTKMATEL